MSSTLAKSDTYKNFRSWVALQKVVCDEKEWQFYDYGPKELTPLVFIPGANTTADAFFQQFVSLSSRGYRMVAVQYPAFWSHSEWVKGFDRFLDQLRVQQAHLFGAALGGYLALCYAQYRPARVASLVLCNAFIDTAHLRQNGALVAALRWLPTFMLQRALLADLPREATEPGQLAALDFVVEQLERVPADLLASRLTLSAQDSYIRPELIRLQPDHVLVIEALDDSAVPERARDEVHKLFPDVKAAPLKKAGPFPFLSASAEVNLLIAIHMRNHGFPELPPPSTNSPSANKFASS